MTAVVVTAVVVTAVMKEMVCRVFAMSRALGLHHLI